MRTIRLTNKTGATLRICIEPAPYHYDLGIGEVADIVGFDPAHEVLEVIVQTDPAGVSVSVESFREDIEVFVAGHRLAVVSDSQS